jgi:hypothetical protein
LETGAEGATFGIVGAVNESWDAGLDDGAGRDSVPWYLRGSLNRRRTLSCNTRCSSVQPLRAMIGGYGRETEFSARSGAVGDLRLDFRIADLVLRAIP